MCQVVTVYPSSSVKSHASTQLHTHQEIKQQFNLLNQLIDSSLPFEMIILQPAIKLSIDCVVGADTETVADIDKHDKMSQESPVILFPHGGPHSSFTSHFDPQTAMFSLLGYAVVRVNYRGSTGFGQTPLLSLPGKCGRQDVDDCMIALHKYLRMSALTKYNNHRKITSKSVGNMDINKDTQDFNSRMSDSLCDNREISDYDESYLTKQPRSLCLFGGSHGGFLVTHMVGQFADTFQACVARNPVTNIAFNVSMSDIPDWCYVECGFKFSEQYKFDAQVHTRMLEMSPVYLVNSVRTPTLIMVGTNDRRVPMAQGVDFYRYLQANQVKSRLIVYPGAQHALNDKCSIHADSSINSAIWFLQHRKDAINVDIRS
jgi:acylaminoacyl-peptidase